ncbi:MAG: hypothetical protein JXA11_12085 [Phycisphaerae bacterium]|nr:hypothetical protein [Phycisphaerae bacterium]
MKEYRSIDIRPYQLLCLICRRGRRDATAYYHESRLDAIQAAVQADPIVPLTLRCNTDTVFRYQNPGREYDTPEGEMYNDLRDLTILQRIAAVPGNTLPAVDWFQAIFDAIQNNTGICEYPQSEAPGWPRCRFADSGNYRRGLEMGVSSIIPARSSREKKKAKIESVNACDQAERLQIRPHHLLCLTCFHGGRAGKELAPIEEDNLCECIRKMQQNPDIPVELVQGPCMVCPPCGAYHPSSNLCIGKQSMGLRDDRKDLDTLRRLGYRYGDVVPARELLQRLYGTVENTTEICGYGDGVERSREWKVCNGPTGSESFVHGRRAGLGVDGATP